MISSSFKIYNNICIYHHIIYSYTASITRHVHKPFFFFSLLPLSPTSTKLSLLAIYTCFSIHCIIPYKITVPFLNIIYISDKRTCIHYNIGDSCYTSTYNEINP
jgi:hypothetical protein